MTQRNGLLLEELNMKTMEYKLKEKTGFMAAPWRPFCVRQTFFWAPKLGPNHMDSIMWIPCKETENDCSHHFYYLFYLCSNTVNCGVTTM